MSTCPGCDLPVEHEGDLCMMCQIIKGGDKPVSRCSLCDDGWTKSIDKTEHHIRFRPGGELYRLPCGNSKTIEAAA